MLIFCLTSGERRKANSMRYRRRNGIPTSTRHVIADPMIPITKTIARMIQMILPEILPPLIMR